MSQNFEGKNGVHSCVEDIENRRAYPPAIAIRFVRMNAGHCLIVC